MENKIFNTSTILPNFLVHNKYIKKVFDLSKESLNNNILPIDNLLIQCPICLEKSMDVYRPNSCSHYFCKKCISIWTQVKNECPYCRGNFLYLIHK